MPVLSAGSSAPRLQPGVSHRVLLRLPTALTSRSPREIDDDVSPALLHLGEGQRRHIAPDFQSFLDGPSHLGFYKLPREPDNSERQQTAGEESISCCPVDAAVMKTLFVGSVALGLPLRPLCHTRASPIHRGTALAPSSKQQIPSVPKPLGCGPRGELSAELHRTTFFWSEGLQRFPGLSSVSPPPQRCLGVVGWDVSSSTSAFFAPGNLGLLTAAGASSAPLQHNRVSGLPQRELSFPSINSVGVRSSQLCFFL